MAQDIKRKIVLEGEKEYSAAIKEAQRNLKTLRSELKAETAELGANATAQQKNEARAKSLQKQIKEQENVVKTLRAALAEAKENYGDNEEVVAKWEQKLNEARATLANMKNDLTTASQAVRETGNSFREAADGAAATVTATKSAADAMSQLSDVGSAVSGAIERAFSFMISTIGNAVSAMWDIVSETAAKANNWTDIAGYWGTDAQTIQMYARAVSASANSFEDLNSAVSKIVMGGKGDKITELLGISGVNYENEWDYAMAVMNRMAELQESGQNMTPIFQEIFGEKKSTQVMDLINDWAIITQNLSTFNGNESGYGLTDEGLEQMDDLWVQINRIEEKWDGLKGRFAEGLGTATGTLLVNVEGGLDSLADYMAAETPEEREAALENLRTNVEEFFTKVGDILKEGIAILDGVGEELKKSDDPLTRMIGDILTSITGALQWIVDNWVAVKIALEGLFGVWFIGKLAAVAGQLSTIMANIETIKGFKGLNMGSGAEGSGTNGTGTNGGAGTGSAGTVNVTTMNTTTENVTTENVTTENVTTENVTTENVTSENVTTENVTTMNVTAGNTTTETVQTMYVQNMVGNNLGGNNPGGNNPGGNGLPGSGGSNLNGYVPVPLPGGNSSLNLPGSGDGLNLPGNNTINLPGDTTLNLPGGGGNDAIKLNPNEYQVSGENVAETGGLLYALEQAGNWFFNSPLSPLSAILGGVMIANQVQYGDPLTFFANTADDEGYFHRLLETQPVESLYGENGELLPEYKGLYGFPPTLDEGKKEAQEWIDFLASQNALHNIYDKYYVPHEETEEEKAKRAEQAAAAAARAEEAEKAPSWAEIVAAQAEKESAEDRLADLTVVGWADDGEEEVSIGAAPYSNQSAAQAQRDAAEAFWDAWRDGDEEEAEATMLALLEVYEGQKEALDALLEKIDALYMDENGRTMEDLPPSWFTDAAAWQNAGGSNGVTSSDLANFRSLPGSMAAAVKSGAAAGVSGIQVQLDGYTVGRLVAPYVSETIARDILV